MSSSRIQLLALTVFTATTVFTICFSELGPNSQSSIENRTFAPNTPESVVRICAELQKVLQEESKYYYNHLHLQYPYLNQEQLQERMAPFRQLLQDKQTPFETKVQLTKVFLANDVTIEMIKKHDPETFHIIQSTPFLVMTALFKE